MSARIPFFPLLLRYLKILGFNLQLIFAEQKRKKNICVFLRSCQEREVHYLQLIGEQERTGLLSAAASPGPGAEPAAGWEGKAGAATAAYCAVISQGGSQASPQLCV